ncbi:terminase large subunit [Pantoea phage vB_PagS_Vid5]|uniref:Terminase large subunit n=1 Tax=Pantoea phage vB_PagS_Vid5 TaxID=2099652 RepID=A0A2P1CKH5_9CAUD|nr:terminase large subunit [Pantoea phage vB_PagS_Vid5]AVJ51757.1 terminase large subunit [Pantoea phage vB_PagS_Vid5]
MTTVEPINIVWKPHPGSQTLSLSCPSKEILYHGTRGPGKTDAQLMRFRKNVGVGFGKFWRGIIFDREYPNLDDLVAKSQRWFPEFGDGARFLSSKSDYKWVWPTGEELLFRAVKRPRDYWKYHGHEYPFIGWNELTKFPDGTLYESMMSCNRSSFLPEEHPLIIDGDIYDRTGRVVLVDKKHRNAVKYFLPEMPLEVFATSNPFGPGHNWVKKYFIDACPMGKIQKTEIEIFNPRTQKKDTVVTTRCHIFGSYRENKNLSPEYIAGLFSITDPNKRDAWLKGSWDITSGGMFDDLWSSLIHKIPRFDIPSSWVIQRSFDWGSSKPFSVGWWAKSDGSDVILANGRRMSTIKGDLFRIGEWYGTTGKANEGLRLLDTQISAGIIQRELTKGMYGRVKPGPADNSIWDVSNGNSTAARMAAPVKINGKQYPGVEWRKSDKSAGSRKNGWKRLREFLYNSIPDRVTGKREKPGIFVFDDCKHFLDLFPSLPRDEDDLDDVDTEVEDHIGDETRYIALDQLMGAGVGRTTGT